MTARKEYRVVVDQNGSEKELLAAFHQASGNITITMIAEKSPEFHHPKYPVENKISIKMSPSSDTPVRSVHATVTHLDGTKSHNYAHFPVVNGKDFFFPVFYSIVGLDSRNNNKGKNSLSRLNLGSYDPTKNALCIFIFLVDSNLLMPDIANFTLETIPFSPYKLVIYKSFAVNAPSPMMSNYIFVRTKPTMLYDHEATEGTDSMFSPIPIESFIYNFQHLVWDLIEDFMDKVEGFHRATSIPSPYPLRGEWKFEREPR